MTDLSDVLPNFDQQPWRHLTFSLHKNDITVSELVALDPVEIIRRCPLPLSELRKFVRAIVQALHEDTSFETESRNKFSSNEISETFSATGDSSLHVKHSESQYSVRTLDPIIDDCLGGGFRTGHVSEIVGERLVLLAHVFAGDI